MVMTRRMFGKASTSALVVLATSSLVGTAGCTPSQAEQDLNAVLTAAVNFLLVADPAASWLDDFKTAVTALKQAEASWVAGGAVQDVINALNVLENVTALIPLTAVYSPLIDVLVTGIDMVLSLFLPATPSAVSAKLNPHKGRAKIAHHVLGNRAAEFKVAWNNAASTSGLSAAHLQ